MTDKLRIAAIRNRSRIFEALVLRETGPDSAPETVWRSVVCGTKAEALAAARAARRRIWNAEG